MLKMTRATRRGNQKNPLPATPWKTLSKNGYTKMEEEEGIDKNKSNSSSGGSVSHRIQKINSGQLKVTKKDKLTERTSKKKRLNNFLAGKKLKPAFNDSETVMLLPSSNTAGGRVLKKPYSNLTSSKKKKHQSSSEDLVQDESYSNSTSSKKKKYGSSSEDLIQDESYSNSTSSKKKKHQSSSEDLVQDESYSNLTSSKKKKYGSSSEDCEYLLVQDESSELNTSNGSRTVNGYSGSQRSKRYSGGVSYMDEKRKKQIEARRLRRQRSKVCFNCRRFGHKVQNCPQPETDSSISGVCFKCGSAEHTSKKCRVKTANGEYPYAKCFICGEIGHLSRSCPDNPKGLYPNGGCCKICGSVEHLKSNCQDKIGQSSGFSSKGLLITASHVSVDAEDPITTSSTSNKGGRKHRQRNNGAGITTKRDSQRIVKF